jgi:hypothetical protein
LHLDACCPATTLTGGAAERGAALAALRALIGVSPDAAFGFDFPFALPQVLMGAGSWTDFALGFGDRYPDADAFRYACREASGWQELKRVTDVEARTPFSPYNLRLYRQTYYGIRDLLAPLVRASLVSVVPMQPVRRGRAPLLEVCPASALKRGDRYAPYKGRTPDHRARREEILAWLVAPDEIVPPADTVRDRAVDDDEGDALDALIATVITFRAVSDGAGLTTDDPLERIEGKVFA